MDPELPEPLPPGEYMTPSIDRYFSSLQSIASNSQFSSENFEPIPEPEMEGVDKFKSKPSVGHSASVNGETHKTTVQNSDQGTDKVKTFETRVMLNGDNNYNSGSSTSKAAGNDSSHTDHQASSNGRDDDDLTLVTSIVSGHTSLTERLKRFGIDKPFGNLSKPPDLFSDVTLDIERKQQEAMAAYKASNTRKLTAEEVFQSFVAEGKADDLSRVSSSTDIEMADESDKTNWTPEVTPSPDHQGNHGNSPRQDKPSIDAMFGVPTTTAKPPKIANNQNTSGKPSAEKKQEYKICPECGVQNKSFLTWCKECGIVLEGEDPIKLNSGGSSRNSRRSSECSASVGSGTLSKSMSMQVSKALTESTPGSQKNNNDSSLPIKVDNFFGVSQNEPSTSGTKPNPISSSKSPVPSTSAGLPPRLLERVYGEGVNDSIDGGSNVRDSSNFEYEHQPNPGLALPTSLKAELSLNLCDTRSNECGDGNDGNEGKSEARRCSENLVALSENIDFEYEKAESPTKQLPYELQEELALNLDDSNTSSMMKAQMVRASENQSKMSQKGKAPGPSVGPAVKSVSPAAGKKSSMKSQPKPGVSFADAVPGPSTSNVNSSMAAAASGGGDGLELRGNNVAKHDMAVGPAGDHEDLFDEDLEVYDDVGDDDAEEAEQEVYQKFLQRLSKDPRFKSKSRAGARTSLGVPQPSQSIGRPKSAGVHGTSRPQSAVSKVKASLEAEPYQRHWSRSSVAWGTYHLGEVRERSPVPNSPALQSSSVKLGNRPTSASGPKKAATAKSGKGGAKFSKARPASAGPKVK